MTGEELLIIGGGLVVGWIIVSKLISEGTSQPVEPAFDSPQEAADNWPAVLAAIRTMTHPEGLGIGARRITVSTVGHPAAVRRLAEVDIPFNLALSLHMPTDAGREQVMPGLGRSDLAATLEAARTRFDRTGRRLTAEVVVMAGINDRDEDARAFARLLAGLPVVVNLIPWNPVPQIPDLARPTDARVDAFADRLRRGGLNVTVRRQRGADRSAA